TSNHTRVFTVPLKDARQTAKTPGPATQNFFVKVEPQKPLPAKVKVKPYEPLFRRRKPHNRDVSGRSAVEPVPGPRQARRPPESPRGTPRFHPHALPKRHAHRTRLAILRQQTSRRPTRLGNSQTHDRQGDRHHVRRHSTSSLPHPRLAQRHRDPGRSPRRLHV